MPRATDPTDFIVVYLDSHSIQIGLYWSVNALWYEHSMSLRLLKKQLLKQVNVGVEANNNNEGESKTEKDPVYAYVSQSAVEEERRKKKLVGKTQASAKATKKKKRNSAANRQGRVSRKTIIASNLSYLKRMG
ncbi:hypothetical protein M9434_003174 [Picochlorum sp. BPE23]|nr:hypothetical protein M9434_003174 [Picochlorum sp. BPE23]